eukprot:NODE_1895_length_1262_cov_30.926628_g1567_i0.p1 GENE.NODE_1895_length_1262_cov_30.926628_g1567_i0~~NODE_1895_length_1262_cov_30.926628_g1567_i0.p1  ORF type:complete len:362 (-),score=74.84 NODE_1895_length_1262_cov_30.926628_g1567_i0:57-1142(-)
MSWFNPVNQVNWFLEAMLLKDPSEEASAGAAGSASDAKPTAKSAPITFELLSLQNDRTSDAVIQRLIARQLFQTVSKRLSSQILQRDQEDDEKLAAGIKISIARGVIPAQPTVEPITKVHVQGKSAEQVATEIFSTLGAGSEGRIIILTGLSGTGKGTTVSFLMKKIPNTQTWSNGNVFRCLTLLAVTHCEKHNIPLDNDALSPDNVKQWMSCLSFGPRPGTTDYDICIKAPSLGLDAYVHDIANTLLKEGKVSKVLPTVAQQTQGEVINFAAGAVETLRQQGVTVIMEGRAQTLSYIRSPHRFELVLDDTDVVGQRQAALRVMSASLLALKDAATKDEQAVSQALDTALDKLAKDVCSED